MGTYQSREAFLESSRKGNEKSAARYRYAKLVLGFPAWKAKMARVSILTLVAMAPKDHVFPPELVAREKKGPKPSARPCPHCGKDTRT